MTITSVTQLAAGREGSADSQGKRSYSVQYLVRTNDGTDGPATILASPLLPTVGNFYLCGRDRDLFARVVDRRCDPGDDPHTWIVTIEYETPDPDDQQDQPPQEPQHPADRTPQVQFRFEQIDQPLIGQYHTQQARNPSDLKGVVNSAGEPFVPPPTKLDARLVIQIDRAERKLNLPQVLLYQNSVNQTAWADFPAETLRLTIGAANESFYQNQRYWQKTYELAYNPNGWATYVLDWGTRRLSDPAGGPDYGTARLEDNFNNPVEAGLLDGAGGTATTAHFLTFYTYHARDFNALKLPVQIVQDRAR